MNLLGHTVRLVGCKTHTAVPVAGKKIFHFTMMFCLLLKCCDSEKKKAWHHHDILLVVATVLYRYVVQSDVNEEMRSKSQMLLCLAYADAAGCQSQVIIITSFHEVKKQKTRRDISETRATCEVEKPEGTRV